MCFVILIEVMTEYVFTSIFYFLIIKVVPNVHILEKEKKDDKARD